MDIHHKIEALRTRKGLTQQALADAVGVSHRAVFAWEHEAAPRKSAIMKLAEVFGVHPSVLLDDLVSLPAWEHPLKDKKAHPEFHEWLDILKETTSKEASCNGRTLVEIMDSIDKKLEKLLEQGKRNG